jgi:hypothetical protein
MDRPVIQSLWIGDELSKLEQLCIASFLKNGHDFHLYTYNQVKGVPEGTVIKDAAEIIPADQVFMYSTGTYAIFADWFRWKLLYVKGGFWVDTDVVCLKPFEFGSDIVFGIAEREIAGVGVLAFPAGHELTGFMHDVCDDPNKLLPYDTMNRKLKKLRRRLMRRGRANVGWGEAGGPTGFTAALKYFKLMDFAKPFTYFYPIAHYNWQAAFDETLADDVDLFSNTYAVHLWNDMIRHMPEFDKNASFPPNSLFEQLKARYLR